MTDINAIFDDNDDERERRLARLPPGEAPKVDAPDLTDYRELDGSYSDKLLANRFFRRYRHLFCNGSGQIYMYLARSGRWTLSDLSTHIYSHAMELSATFHDELAEVKRARAQALTDNNAAQAEALGRREQGLASLIKHTEKGGTIGTIAKMVQAKVKTVLECEQVKMNSDPQLLACRNGVVNLADGSLRYAQMDDYITRNTGIDYVPGADTSWWNERVLEMCHGNTRLAEYLQVWFGYCATGYTREHCMTVLYGAGRNGKNLLMDAVATALGGYASAITASFLEAQGKESGDSNNILYMTAQLDGTRMAYVSETGERGKLRESTVKSLTGDKRIRARLAYENFYEFEITHKFTIGTNHKPEISGTDDGVWARMRLVPMRVKFGEQAEVDAGVAQYLQDETLLDVVQHEDKREQVLAWVVEGARKYIKHGLKSHTPPEISAETKAYRREQDVLGQFLQHVSVHVPQQEIDRTVARVEAVRPRDRGQFSDEDMLRVDKMDLWRTYAVWASDNGHYAMSSTMFARRITGAQRFWPGDGTGELQMRPLEAIRTDRGARYVFFRWSEQGQQLRDHARSQMRPRKVDHGDMDRPF